MRMLRYIKLKLRQELKSKFTYKVIFNSRLLFFCAIILIFHHLWSTLVPLKKINGNNHLIWYFIMIESILIAQPGIFSLHDSRFIKGEYIYDVIRPISLKTILIIDSGVSAVLNYFTYIFIGSLIGYILTNQTPFFYSYFYAGVVLGAFSALLDSSIKVLIKLSTFWIKKPLFLILTYHKLLFILGGIFLPISMYPKWIQVISNFLPFKTIFYMPSTLILTGNFSNMPLNITSMAVWFLVTFLFLDIFYKRGIQKIAKIGI